MLSSFLDGCTSLGNSRILHFIPSSGYISQENTKWLDTQTHTCLCSLFALLRDVRDTRSRMEPSLGPQEEQKHGFPSAPKAMQALPLAGGP